MIRKRAKRLAGAVLAAGAITAMPFQAFAQRSPEFAYSAENGRHSATISWSLMKFQI
ncbi:MAG: hypothetical protein ACLUD2_03305 [Clostridium sp.]